jgi:carbon storage regulator
MLILSRKLDEQILIGDGIVITVVSIRGGKVRIGIEAPPNVSIHRQEVLQSQSEKPDAEPSEAQAGGADGRSGSDSVR